MAEANAKISFCHFDIFNPSKTCFFAAESSGGCKKRRLKRV
jgi:hypothetical protein